MGDTLPKWTAAEWQEWKGQRLEPEVAKIVEEARASIAAQLAAASESGELLSTLT